MTDKTETNTTKEPYSVSKSELSDLLACKNKCAVTDFEGNHCPEPPTTAVVVNDKKIMLCPRCAINIANGMYGIMNIS